MRITQDHNISLFCIMDKIGIATLQNKRQYMEDTYVVSPLKSPCSFMVGVFDGHGGDEVAKICRENFKEVLQQSLVTYTHDINIAIRAAFADADSLVKQLGASSTVGSTAVIAIVTKDRIWFANAGDSMAMAVVYGQPMLFSSEHKVENEKDRIKAEGGYITYWDGVARVNGTLNVSRALGDYYLKKHVNSDPFLKSCKLSEVSYFLLASDGIWDVMSCQDIHAIVSRIGLENTKDAADAVVKVAVERGSTDNITVVLVPL